MNQDSNQDSPNSPPEPEFDVGAAPKDISASGDGPRERIIEAFMTLLADRSIEQIGLPEVAATAGVTLSEMRAEFSSTLAILAGHIRDLDRKVLEVDTADMTEEPARERLFDVLMRRLELLASHRAAIRSLMRSARQNPPLALALNGMATRSQQWMLAAADISASGPRGMMRAQGLALLFANVLRTWVDDEDPGMARTLAALDRELARGQSLAGVMDGLLRVPEAACRVLGGMRRPRRARRDAYPDETYAA